MTASSFKETGINTDLVKALAVQSITEPTEIQIQAIPELLKGIDVIGCSETGTGKTLAYLLPLLMRIDQQKTSNQAIILAPTHELAIQIFREIEKLVTAGGLKITSAQCIGGANINRQIDKLKKKPHIIVGSTGRILELITAKKINPDIGTLVIDEADRMLDDNNFNLLLRLVRTLVKTARQTILFSASIGSETIKRAKAVTKDAVFIKTTQRIEINQNLEHFYIECDKRDKILLVRKFYAAFADKKALVFVNNDVLVAELSEKLSFHNLKISAIHGRFKKFERKTALENFRKGAARFLISSDISARGLDVKDIDFIINFDMPEESLDYLHRTGRSARAGKVGSAVSFVTPPELKLLLKYSKHFKFELKKAQFHDGELHIK
ncbi:MAG TPA: DEAD/DEAH box helicase [bacterium]|nr:DEAD/DEAH box helicase [bacterium]